MPVVGLGDFKEENDDEKRQAYYAGGQGQNGGGSGQEVLDPRDLMRRARDEMGAETEGEWKANQPSGTAAFTGAGQSLSGESVQGAAAPSRPQEHTITFWANGFSVDDGPLRSADDPANAAFLAAVNSGRMPAELVGEDADAEADVHLIDKSGEPYKAPPVVFKAFGGGGRSMSDENAGSSSAAPPAPTEGEELSVDPSQPTTSLQIRLLDGSRKVVKANHSHTVRRRHNSPTSRVTSCHAHGVSVASSVWPFNRWRVVAPCHAQVLQLQSHVASLTPGVAFTLRGGYPPKTLTEMGQTLAEAKLLNESIIQSKA